MNIKKRSGEITSFDPVKITLAISKAYVDVNYKANSELTDKIAQDVITEIAAVFEGRVPGVEDVQNMVEKKLMENGLFEVAKSYIIYRYEHTKVREEKKQEILEKIENSEVMVTKRNGTTEPFSIIKIKNSLEKIVGEFKADLDIDLIINQVRLEVYEDIATSEIERALIMVLRSFIEKDPAYSKVAAIALSNQLY